MELLWFLLGLLGYMFARRVYFWYRLLQSIEPLNMDLMTLVIQKQNGTFNSYLKERYEYTVGVIAWQMRREVESALKAQQLDREQIDAMTSTAFEMLMNGATLQRYLTRVEHQNKVWYGFNLITPTQVFFCLKPQPWKFVDNALTAKQAHAIFLKVTENSTTKPVKR